jgi:1-acyl-sn-glycerol-3-phosphate acyltransferase
VTFEHFTPPTTPVLFASNSTQKNDFMPIRAEWVRRGVKAVTVTKGKNYHLRGFGWLLGKVGVIPLASRGYLLLVDFTALLKRRPTEAEYRALRSHLDEGTPLPESADFERLQRAPRELMGLPFEPVTRGYRAALAEVYAWSMGHTLRLAREVVSAGYSIQMYPEGTVSSRLGKGRVGAVQLAHALGLVIVPVGMSGCREVFRGQGFALRGGEVRVRFGEPYALPRHELPDDFRPFHPDDEARHRPVLQRWTGEVMSRLDALLDAPYRHVEGFEGDGTQGTRRFL